MAQTKHGTLGRDRNDANYGQNACVRLLKTVNHGESGAVVAVSISRARDLISRGDAVEVMPDGSLVPEGFDS